MAISSPRLPRLVKMMTAKPDVHNDLLPMDTAENILRHLQVILARLEAGTFPKGNGGPAVRACETALKAIEAGATIRRVKELEALYERAEAEIERLRKQLTNRRVA